MLEGILAKGTELCDSEAGWITLGNEGRLEFVAAHGESAKPHVGTVLPLGAQLPAGMVVSPYGANSTDDFGRIAADDPFMSEFARSVGIGSYANSLLILDGQPRGGIHMIRHDIRPFDDAALSRLGSFAEQASLAIANARLFNDLDQSLALQTAASEILELISAHPGDLPTVLDGILERAATLCDADGSLIMLRDGEVLRLTAVHGGGAELVAGMTFRYRDDGRDVNTLARDRGSPVLVDDLQALAGPALGELFSTVRSWAIVALTLDDEWIGNIHLRRRDVRPFDDRLSSVLQAFADHAAIAVANARLFNDLAESLELQTATSEILELISDNPGDLQAVFEGIVAQAAQLCDADAAAIMRREGDDLVLAVVSVEENRPDIGRRTNLPVGVDLSGPIFLDDMSGLTSSQSQPIGSMVTVPLIIEHEHYGQINVSRFDVRPFEPRHGRIVQTFADQAAIAIGNARLFNDLDEALDRQTAMTEVLDAVSTSRFDLQPVFDVLAHHANRLCGGTGAGVGILEGDVIVVRSASGGLGGAAQLEWPLDDESMVGASALHREVIHVRNWEDEPPDRYARSGSRIADRKSALTIPMVRNDTVVGVVAFSRPEPGGYSDGELSLLQTFANQAAVAIDNARLLREIELRNTELAESLELQTATSEVLKLISSNPGDLEMVLSGIVAQAARLCDADVASVTRHEGDEGVLIAVSESGNAGDLGYRFALPPVATRGRLNRFDDVSGLIRVGPGSRQIRSTIVAPLVVDDAVYGSLGLSRWEVRPFDERQAQIAQAFADQASIAIANARLFNDLDESLELQTATSHVLQLISDNPGNLDAVFDGIVQQAARLCDADMAGIMRREGDEFVLIGVSDPRASGELGYRRPVQPDVDYRLPTFIDDFLSLGPYEAEFPAAQHRECRHVRRRRPLRADQRQPARRPSVRAAPRQNRPGLCRAGSDRDQQRQPLRPVGGSDPPRRGGKCGEGVVPGDDESRDPYADECGDRDEWAVARHRAPTAAARVRRDHPIERRVTTRDHQRHPRLLEDRRGATGVGGAPVRPPGVRGVGVRPRDRTGSAQGARTRLPDRPSGSRRTER